MIQARYLYRTEEVVKWLLLAAMASLVLVAFAARTAGAQTEAVEPSRFPVDLAAGATSLTDVESLSPADALRAAIELQAGDRSHEALEIWNGLRLPAKTEVWRQLAMAVAHLDQGDWHPAVECLKSARKLQPHNAVGHYLTGLVRLEQGAAGHQWDDALGPATVRLADYRPEAQLQHPRSTYELMAMEELEQAIATAGDVNWSHPLLGKVDGSLTVRDLLTAARLDQFEADAHHLLGDLCLRRDLLERAESHFDDAYRLGVPVVYGYRELAEKYEGGDRYADAARAYAKDMKQGGDVAVPAKKFFENLRKAFVAGR